MTPTTRALTGFFLLSTGCSTVHSAAIPSTNVRYAPHQGPVTVSATTDPPEGTQLGEVMASGMTTIEEVVPELVTRTAQLGGNYTRIDELSTRYQWMTRPVTQTYNCGSYRFPMTCTRTYYQQEEVGVLTARGRAFRVGMP